MAAFDVTAAQLLSIPISLIAAGGIATLTIFDIPELQSQPASRSLPATRWLFSRGSHIFPQAAALASAGFTYLAYSALPASNRGLLQLARVASNSGTVNGYLVAAALSIGIAPYTVLVMAKTNFEIIELNRKIGGSRSDASAKRMHVSGEEQRSLGDALNGKGEVSEITDLSGPQEATSRKSTPAQDERARQLMTTFARLNLGRALLIGAGGIVGLWTAVTV